MFYKSEKWAEILFVRKTSAYEDALKAFWTLLGRASGAKGLTAQDYYGLASKTAAVELYCTQEIGDAVSALEMAILRLSASKGTLEERTVYQDQAVTEMETLVKLMRIDIGLESIGNFIQRLDDETNAALLEDWAQENSNEDI